VIRSISGEYREEIGHSAFTKNRRWTVPAAGDRGVDVRPSRSRTEIGAGACKSARETMAEAIHPGIVRFKSNGV
jgi:hypothetical protein